MNPMRKAMVGAAIVGSTLTGGAIGALLINGAAGAQTASTDQSTTAAPAAASSGTDSSGTATPAAPAAAPSGAPTGQPGGPAGPGGTFDPSKGGHQANGITEAVLTGDDLTKATDAANAAVSGGTVIRAETDAEGAKYEVHMKKSDGSLVTVKLDASFKVTSVEDGMK